MANEEHLAILRRGVEEWNRWREENPKIVPNLRNADLEEAHLSDANLVEAILVEAILDRSILERAILDRVYLDDASLEGASLQDASVRCAILDRVRLDFADLDRSNLSETSLKGAVLKNARVRGASLESANLQGTILDGASLVGSSLVSANLVDANLYGARLRDACFDKAIVGGTTFANVDLHQLRGSDTSTHSIPSIISTSTLERSLGQIPEVFLKGCGLSDWEIEAAKLYNPDLTEDQINFHMYEVVRLRGEQPIMRTRLFISYSHADSKFVEALEPLLDDKGVRYWRDVHEMRAGRMEKQIDRGITLNPLVLVILSESSVRSDWVEDEATKARELERQYRDQGKPRDVLCPIALDDSWKRNDWPRWLRRQIEDYAILDFSGWRDPVALKKQFGKLYEGIVLNYKA